MCQAAAICPRKRACRDRQDERVAEASYQKERDVERREAERRAHELDQAYKSALRKWELHEKLVTSTMSARIINFTPAPQVYYLPCHNHCPCKAEVIREHHHKLLMLAVWQQNALYS